MYVEKSMNNISQISVFDYREIEILGDLERIKLFFENLVPPARAFSGFITKLKK